MSWAIENTCEAGVLYPHLSGFSYLAEMPTIAIVDHPTFSHTNRKPEPVRHGSEAVACRFTRVGALSDEAGRGATPELAKRGGLGVGAGLAEADDLVAVLELAALAEEIDALEALEDVSFRGDGAGTFEAAML